MRCFGFSFLALITVVFGICYASDRGPQVFEAETSAGFRHPTGLAAETIQRGLGRQSVVSADFERRAGAAYKPSDNEDPTIPAQCWIETGYGTQNACKYCHTNALAELKHGNAFPIAEDQVLYSFPSPGLNRINWPNIIAPQELIERLKRANIPVPQPDDPENLTYVRTDNWHAAYAKARSDGDTSWDNRAKAASDFQLLPALDPEDLFPLKEGDPTDQGRHGYVDRTGLVRNRRHQYTGWRAVSFFPYAIFTPLTGSVSGIYIRLPSKFMTLDGTVDSHVLRKNLALLERNIKNLPVKRRTYFGDAKDVVIKKGFYPVGTEFAHPLHYVDLNADGESGTGLDALSDPKAYGYEFPGTRSKRVKEVRYLYKWEDVNLEDIGEDEESHDSVLGKEGKGWIDNGAGWIIAGFIEDRRGELRPQTTEELLQCLGCHSSVGNTVDTVWSFQRKLPGESGWREMDYGDYRATRKHQTRLQDFLNANVAKGELEYFYGSVVGADLFGVMPEEIKAELMAYAVDQKLPETLPLEHDLPTIFDDERLKNTPKRRRQAILRERARLMRHFAAAHAYLYHDSETGKDYIKGSVFYPSEKTMKAHIAGYRRVVLDQSFNLGKATFGTQADAIPFTFRSDGTVRNSERRLIPVGHVIDSRPWGPEGVGTTPTGIVRVNAKGQAVDPHGKIVDLNQSPEQAQGHVTAGGTFDMRYTPILQDQPVTLRDVH